MTVIRWDRPSSAFLGPGSDRRELIWTVILIDFATVDHQPDLWQAVQQVLEATSAIDRTAILRTRLDEVNWILFLADNAGETVFDRILIETSPRHVRYAAKRGAGSQ